MKNEFALRSQLRTTRYSQANFRKATSSTPSPARTTGELSKPHMHCVGVKSHLVAVLKNEALDALWKMQMKLNEKLQVFSDSLRATSIFRDLSTRTMYLLFELMQRLNVEQTDQESNACEVIVEIKFSLIMSQNESKVIGFNNRTS